MVCSAHRDASTTSPSMRALAGEPAASTAAPVNPEPGPVAAGVSSVGRTRHRRSCLTGTAGPGCRSRLPGRAIGVPSERLALDVYRRAARVPRQVDHVSAAFLWVLASTRASTGDVEATELA